jgi:hypothetical protein
VERAAAARKRGELRLGRAAAKRDRAQRLGGPPRAPVGGGRWRRWARRGVAGRARERRERREQHERRAGGWLVRRRGRQAAAPHRPPSSATSCLGWYQCSSKLHWTVKPGMLMLAVASMAAKVGADGARSLLQRRRRQRPAGRGAPEARGDGLRAALFFDKGARERRCASAASATAPRTFCAQSLAPFGSVHRVRPRTCVHSCSTCRRQAEKGCAQQSDAKIEHEAACSGDEQN